MRIVLGLALATLIGLATLALLGNGEAPLRAETAAAEAQAETETDEGGGLLGWIEEKAAQAKPDPEPAGNVYYQYVDDSGTVHFVGSLEEVPGEWRDRAGRVEMAARTKPAKKAKASRKAKARKQPTRRVAQRRARPEPAPVARASFQDVDVYTTSWCGWCRKTLAHLDRRGVDYVNKDIEADDDYRDELIEITGRTSIPVVVIDGEVIRGYDPRKMDALLSP